MSGNIKQAAAAARRASQLLATTPEAVRDEALAAAELEECVAQAEWEAEEKVREQVEAEKQKLKEEKKARRQAKLDDGDGLLRDRSQEAFEDVLRW